jgi:indolepyruvate ferredoxin oxidoreductase
MLCDRLDRTASDTALALAALPDMVRGYGPVKEEAMAHYAEARAALIARLDERPAERVAA